MKKFFKVMYFLAYDITFIYALITYWDELGSGKYHILLILFILFFTYSIYYTLKNE